jgi:hypothetical protein
MALPTATTLEEDANWAVECATALPEFWALVAENSDGLVDAWRLMSVCTASREGLKTFLSTDPNKSDWKNLVTNFTSVLASAAKVNHSSVTNFLSDFHSSEMQATIRSRFDGAIKTIDSAGIGSYDIYKTFKMAMSFNRSLCMRRLGCRRGA